MTLQVIPYIMLDGQAGEAIDFYVQALDAKVLFKQTIGEGPENPEFPLTIEEKQRVAHSVLQVGTTEMYVADLDRGQSYQSGNQVTICITADVREQAKPIYDALLQDGQVIMPLQETYFSPAYGMVTDKFGVTFQIFTKRQR
ncbi:VOC family protein [Paenibacillus sp. FSL H8-0034]|uniref:VOC family protein n=1 Tax=Paenibacillus sp. FSL H8-0034 TaxID=2954671 RepID=UPI0030F8BBFF